MGKKSKKPNFLVSFFGKHKDVKKYNSYLAMCVETNNAYDRNYISFCVICQVFFIKNLKFIFIFSEASNSRV